MVIYPDASALVALFKPEVHTSRATAILNDRMMTVQLSDFTVAEVSAALAALLRLQRISAEAALSRFGQFDQLARDFGAVLPIEPGDVAAATSFVRHPDVRLRAADAIHLAICRRIGATLLTFDGNQAAAAAALGIPLVA